MWGVDGGVGYVGCGWRGGICGVWMEGWDMWGVDGGVGYVGCGWRGGICGVWMEGWDMWGVDGGVGLLQGKCTVYVRLQIKNQMIFRHWKNVF